MRVFITGAAGFIGTATTTELIANGHQVLGLARSDANAEALKKLGAEVHRGSLDDLASLRVGARTTDGTIHLAFIHDFAKFAENGQIDKRAIEAMGDVLEGTNKPFIVTSGTGLVSPGHDGSPRKRMRRHARILPRKGSGTGGPRLCRARRARDGPCGCRRCTEATSKCGLVEACFSRSRRRKRVSGYIGDGTNRWSGAHRLDVARLYRLALEKGAAGRSFRHAVGG